MTGGFIRFSDDDLDPAVRATISQGKKRQDTSRLPKAERKKKAREAAKTEKRRGARASYDLRPEVIQATKDLADHYRVSASGIVDLAVCLLLENWLAGNIQIEDYLQPITNTKYEAVVHTMDLFEALSRDLHKFINGGHPHK